MRTAKQLVDELHAVENQRIETRSELKKMAVNDLLLLREQIDGLLFKMNSDLIKYTSYTDFLPVDNQHKLAERSFLDWICTNEKRLHK